MTQLLESVANLEADYDYEDSDLVADNIAFNENSLDDNDRQPEAVSENDIKKFLTLFFDGLSAPFGGPVQGRKICTSKNIDLVMYMRLFESIEMFYQCLTDAGWDDVAQYHKFVELQCKAKRAGVPKFFSGGLLLIWLELCAGIEMN